MATKKLKDKVINVRATDHTVAVLKVLCERCNMKQSDLIAYALDELYKNKK